MRKLTIHICLTLIFLLGLSLHSKAQFTETREINRSFKVSEDARIEITNKYGKVDINTWDKDSVKIHIKLKIEEKKLSRLQKTLSNIDFNFNQTSHLLLITTQIGKSNSGFENELFRLKETVLNSGGSTTRIDYKVWLPKNNDLKIDNKFGDIYIDDYPGQLRVVLSNGKLKANNLSGKSDLSILFGSASITSLTDSRIKSSYSDWYVKDAGSTMISSKSSTIEFVKVNKFYAESRRDRFRIRETVDFETNGNFSDYRIEHIAERLRGSLSYGDFELSNAKQGFDLIKLTSRSTDISLGFTNTDIFNFKIDRTKTSFDYDDKFTVEEDEVISIRDSRNRTIGYLNKKQDKDEDKLIILSTGGSIRISSD
ncbi:hypothetical protein EYV94_22555 [Puteibacter caeruleilacunae]|nr:hypothetical protein EYV94_22555 [Puteibacter caeruleilacunae]